MARLLRAPSASPRSAPSSPAPASRKPSGNTCRATPRRALTSGSRSQGASYILMNSPKRPDGPPVRDGKPYSAIAHLAENVTPFVAMAQALARAGSVRAGDLCRRPRGRVAGDRGPRQRTGGRWRPAGADRAALRSGGRSLGGAAPRAAARRAHRRAGRRLHPAALRPRRVPDRGRAAGRLVSAAARRQACRATSAMPMSNSGAKRWRRCSRHPRPGCCAIIIRPICCGCRSAQASRASACSISRTR